VLVPEQQPRSAICASVAACFAATPEIVGCAVFRIGKKGTYAMPRSREAGAVELAVDLRPRVAD
jgi:hypothetical protein